MNQLVLELTNRCNFHCQMCIAADKRDYSEMSIEQVKDILDQTKKLEFPDDKEKVWMVSFHGLGEPLLHRDVVEAVRYAKKLGFYTGFVTNGSMLTEELSRALLAENMDYICFSVNGVDLNVYKEFQGYGFQSETAAQNMLDKVLNNIRIFLKLKKEMGKKTEVRISYIMTEQSKKHFKAFVKYWENTGYEIMIQVLKMMEWKYTNKTRYTRCERVNQDFIIFANGIVSGCGCDHLRGNAVGNVNKEKLQDIINSDKYKTFMDIHKKMDMENMPEACKRCNHLINFGFCKNYSVAENILYVNNTKKRIKWAIYIKAYILFTELKKSDLTYPLWRNVTDFMRKKETRKNER